MPMTEEQKKLAAALRATFGERLSERGIWIESQVNTAFEILIDAIAVHMTPAAAAAPVQLIDAAQVESLVKGTVESIVARMKDEAAPPAERIAACAALYDAAFPAEAAVPAVTEQPAPAPTPPESAAPSLDTMLAAASAPVAVDTSTSSPPASEATITATGRKARGNRGQPQP